MGTTGHFHTVVEYSTDYGRTWEMGSLPNRVYMVPFEAAMSCVANGSQVDCAMRYATWGPGSTVEGDEADYSTNGGATWVAATMPVEPVVADGIWAPELDCFRVPQSIDCLAVDIEHGGMLWSVDGGAQWSLSARPAAPYVVPSTYDNVFACGMVGSSLDCALDGGVTWSGGTPLPPPDFDEVTAYYSTNAGKWWAKSSVPKRTGNLDFVACAAVAGSLRCAALGTQPVAPNGPILTGLIGSYTTNGGVSWANATVPGSMYLNAKENGLGISSLSCSPEDTTLSCQAGIWADKSGKAFAETIYSRDGGETWTT